MLPPGDSGETRDRSVVRRLREQRTRHPAKAVDDSAVTCEECGHALGFLAEIKTRVEQAVLGDRARAGKGSGTLVPACEDAIDRRSWEEQ
jgi:hypothetical protein